MINMADLKQICKKLDELGKVVIGLQKSHIKLQVKVYGDKSKEIYEEDNWNLADEATKTYIGDFSTDNIKTFIQKVKGDVKKQYQRGGTPIPLDYLQVEDIIDKRVGFKNEVKENGCAD